MIVDGHDIRVIFSMDAKNRSPTEFLDYGDGFSLNESPVSVSYDGVAVFVNKTLRAAGVSAVEQHLKDLHFLHDKIGVDAVYVYKRTIDNQDVACALCSGARRLGVKIIMEEAESDDNFDFAMPFIPTAQDKKNLFNFLGAKPIDKSVELMWFGLNDKIRSLPELSEFFPSPSKIRPSLRC